MFTTLLCIPPDYDRYYPPLGTPALAAFLKKNGIACVQSDLNLGYRDFLTQKVSGPYALDRHERLFFLEPLISKFFAQKLKGRYYSDFLPRTDRGVLPHLPYGNNTNSSFYFCERLLSSGHLMRYLEDKDENTFYQFYRKTGILSALEKDGVDLLGISVISPAQVIASLTLGLLVKKNLPHIHVTIGGQWPTLYRGAIAQKMELFSCFDSIIVFEGEHALCELAKRLEAKGDVNSIPNTITADNACGMSSARTEEDMNSLPCPDFDGLPLSDYDDSKDGRISLTYETSRGCYWSKCAYCVDLPLPKPSYRKKDAALVVEDIIKLKKLYDAKYLLFGDPGLSPRQMREISVRMIDKRVDMGWWTMARLDPGFDRRLFDLAHAAGLRQVNFGFESASDRVCGRLEKGNKRDLSSRIIRDCHQAGIKVDLQTMLGLPGESFEDGMETVDFLISHKKFISHVTFNTYYLTPFNFVHQCPAKYGIDYDSRPDLPFMFFIPFKNNNGMSADQAHLLEKMYYSLLNKDSGPSGPDVSAGRGDVSQGYVEFSLNNESCRLDYRCDAKTKVYTFIEDESDPAKNHDPACLSS